VIRVLFLGGAGMIGSACAAEAVRQGLDVTVVTRTARPTPEGVHHIQADIHDLSDFGSYDSVVNWVGYTPADLHLEADAGQYVFISTCSIFARPAALLPITESTPRSNLAWPYPRDKVACELALEAAHREHGFPVTIVRPTHVYDDTVLPFPVGWTAIDRMRRGEPVVVHGDGASLWNLTHSADFARAFVPLLANPHTVGESVNVCSDELLTWDQIHLTLAAAAGVREPTLIHRSSETIEAEVPGWSPVLTHDFGHTVVYDTTKLRRLVPGFTPQVPFARAAHRIIDWHDADPSRQTVDEKLVKAWDRLTP
jgi:nucleoside-diphosphate-sugar epimerase